tara:strand:+ start:260 stop:466 length:207 start_codon:yes stop_codon:yes gene_type:complete
MVAGPRGGKMKASKKAQTIASLREISPGVMVNKNYKPGKDPALDKVLQDLKGDPNKLNKSGMSNHYKI